MVKTNLKPRDYLPHEAVRIVNPKQALLYIKNGVYPIDMYASIDEKTTLQPVALRNVTGGSIGIIVFIAHVPQRAIPKSLQ